MYDNPQTPCSGSDEWTREPNKNDSPVKRIADTSATLRAKIACFSCPIRLACLKAAFEPVITPFTEIESEDSSGRHDWHVWGGYTGGERTRWRAGELHFSPGRTPHQSGMQRIYELMSGDDIDEIAERHGLSTQGLVNQLNAYIWTLRDQAGDSDLTWDVVPETQESGTGELVQTVRAA